LFKQFDIVKLKKTGERVTILDFWDSENLVVEKGLPCGDSEILDVTLDDIEALL
jgi:hypothetical protein